MCANKLLDEKKIVLVLLNWSFSTTQICVPIHTWGGACFHLGEAAYCGVFEVQVLLVQTLLVGTYEMYVIIFSAFSNIKTNVAETSALISMQNIYVFIVQTCILLAYVAFSHAL